MLHPAAGHEVRRVSVARRQVHPEVALRGSRLSHDATHTLRRIPLASSRTASPRPLPSCRCPSSRASPLPLARDSCASPPGKPGWVRLATPRVSGASSRCARGLRRHRSAHTPEGVLTRAPALPREGATRPEPRCSSPLLDPSLSRHRCLQSGLVWCADAPPANIRIRRSSRSWTTLASPGPRSGSDPRVGCPLRAPWSPRCPGLGSTLPADAPSVSGAARPQAPSRSGRLQGLAPPTSP